MGRWDEFNSHVSRLINRIRPAKNSSEGDPEVPKRAGALVANVTKVADAAIVNVAQKLDEYIPDPRRREKIRKILYDIGSFAVESAINESLKGVTGAVHVYKIVKEGLQDDPNSYPRQGINKKDLMIAMDEMEAKLEKMHEDMNILKQQNQLSPVNSRDGVPLKVSSGEPLNSMTSLPADKKKVFIRSRL